MEKNLPDYENLGLLELFKQFDLLFEAQDEKETFWIAPQYLPLSLENDKSFKKQFNKSKLALVFRFSRFMPDNVMINFLSRYGSFADDIFWKKGIYFTKNETDCIVLQENETDLQVWIDKNQESEVLLREIVWAFSEFGKNAKTEISLDNHDFVSFQELKNDYEKGFQEIKSLQGNRLATKEFGFLFEQIRNTISSRNGISEQIQAILTEIDNYDLAKSFEMLDALGINTPEYNRLKQTYILGKDDVDYIGRLKTFVKNINI